MSARIEGPRYQPLTEIRASSATAAPATQAAGPVESVTDDATTPAAPGDVSEVRALPTETIANQDALDAVETLQQAFADGLLDPGEASALLDLLENGELSLDDFSPEQRSQWEASQAAATTEDLTETQTTPALEGAEDPEATQVDYSGIAAGADLTHKTTKRGYERFVLSDNRGGPNMFEARSRELDQQTATLESEISELRAAGGNPERIAALERARNLSQSLSGLYTRLEESRRTGRNGQEADIQGVMAELGQVTQALEAAQGEIGEAAFGSLQTELGNIRTVVATYAQAPQPRPEGNLGMFAAKTFERLREIQAGERRRANETPDIQGALRTYTNDNTDMAAFVQRLTELNSRIRSGNLTPADARRIAQQGITGTSSRFQGEYMNLVEAELRMQSARQNAAAAQAAVAAGNRDVDQAQGQIASGRGADQQAQQSAGQGRTQLGAGDRTAAAASTEQARVSAGQRDAAYAGAESSLDSARAQQGRAASLTDAAERDAEDARLRLGRAGQGAYAAELGGSIASSQGQLQIVDGEVAGARTATDALGDRIATTDADLEAARAEAQQTDSQIELVDQDIAAQLQAAEARGFEEVELGRDLRNFDDSIALLNSEGDAIRLTLKADGSVGAGFLRARAQAQLGVEVTMLENGKFAVRFTGEAQAGVQANGGAGRASLSAGVAGGAVYVLQDRQELNDFLLYQVRQRVPLADQVFPQMQRPGSDVSAIRPTTYIGGFIEADGTLGFMGAELNLTGRGQMNRVFLSNGQTSIDESITGSFNLKFSDQLSISGSVRRYSVENDTVPENIGQYLSADLRLSLQLTPGQRSSWGTSPATRESIRGQLIGAGQRMGLTGAALDSFVGNSMSKVGESARTGQTRVALAVEAEWEVPSESRRFSQDPGAAVGPLMYVRVGTSVSTEARSSGDFGIARYEVSARAEYEDQSTIPNPDNTGYAQTRYFGTPASRQRYVQELPEGLDTRVTRSDGSTTTMRDVFAEFASWEQQADRLAAGDPQRRAALLDEYRRNGGP